MDIEELERLVPCRQQQMELLLGLMGEKEQWTVPSMFLYGHTGTGKSLVVNTLLESLQLKHVVVNCVECYTSRLMYEHILNEVSGVTPAPDNDFACYARCDNMNDFVKMLKLLLEEQAIKETVYIVFDKVERLRDMDINLLPAFLRLQELTGSNICVLLLSEIVWEKFRTGTGFLEPFPIHFPDYSKDDMLEIISVDCPAEYPESFYRGYCSLLMSVFHVVCRNLNELRHLAALNFPKYAEPVKNGTGQNGGALLAVLKGHVPTATAGFGLNQSVMILSAQWEKMQQEADEQAATGLTPCNRANLELPFYSKYLLIAAYLASYNPMKTDRRFFAMRDSKVSKRAQLAAMKKNERTSNQLLGPKPFPLDRLMAIFYAIVEGKVAPTANIFSQITSLTTLGLMAQAASADYLDAPKYKCLVSLDFIQSIGRTVNFDVAAYVYDLL